VFKIHNPTPAIYLVIRIEKLFCGGDMDKEIAAYLKAKYVRVDFSSSTGHNADWLVVGRLRQAKVREASKLREEIDSFVKQNKAAFKNRPYPLQPLAWVRRSLSKHFFAHLSLSALSALLGGWSYLHRDVQLANRRLQHDEGRPHRADHQERSL